MTPLVDAGRPALNVLMVAPTSFFNDYGGHIRILEEALALQAMGQRVRIVTYNEGKDVAGVAIQRTWRLPWHAGYEVGSSRHKLAFDLYLAAKAIQVAAGWRPDVIHGHMHEGALIGGLLARLWRAPLVFDFQGSLTAEMVDHRFLNPDGRIYAWARWLERFICRLPAAILTSSHQAAEMLAADFGVPECRIHPLPDCVDLKRFDPGRFDAGRKAELKARLGIPAGRPVVAYLGLLADYQGTPDLVAAAARLKAAGERVHLLIMGYPRVDEYRALARQAGLAEEITFTGRVNYADAPLYLSLGDLAVSAKFSTSEGSGKILNYMAMAQPVVAYDTPVHREYLAGLGHYAPVGDVDCLAQLLASLAQRPDRRAELGGRLRQRAAEYYGWAQAAGSILGLYQALTKG
ncbi:MAG: glycosyltransferase [Candidatus Promineifilaceae bacterium]